MTYAKWLPSEAEIKAHCQRQREERIRLAMRVDDGPQTILVEPCQPAKQAIGDFEDVVGKPAWRPKEVAQGLAYGIAAGLALVAFLAAIALAVLALPW